MFLGPDSTMMFGCAHTRSDSCVCATSGEKASRESYFIRFQRLESFWSLRPEIGVASHWCWKDMGVLGFAAERWFISVQITWDLPLWSLTLCC